MEPNAAPLYVLVSKLNKRVAINTKVEWLEDVLNPSWTTFSASASANATVLTVSNGNIFNQYDLIKVPSTGEIMLVRAQSSTQITAFRAYGETNSADIANGADVVIIGSAFPEGSVASALVTLSTQTTLAYNYLQLFRKSIEITRTLANTELLNLGAHICKYMVKTL